MQTHEGSTRRQQGYSLIEILVALAIFGVLGQGFLTFFRSGVRQQSNADTRVETHHALVATMDTLTRDIRLAGGCFPSTGTFVSMGGVNGGLGQDQLILRFGRTKNQACLQTGLASDAVVNGHNLVLPSAAVAQDYPAGTVGYITNGNTGNFFKVLQVTGGTTLVTDGTWSVAYTAAMSGVYAMQERIYSLCSAGICQDGDPGPAIQLARDREPLPHPFADGITALDVRYRLVDGSMRDLPTTDAEWRLVKEVLVSVTAQSSVGKLAGGGLHKETSNLTIKPRNLQP